MIGRDTGIGTWHDREGHWHWNNRHGIIGRDTGIGTWHNREGHWHWNMA